MQSRRDALKQLAGLAAVVAVTPSALSAASATRHAGDDGNDVGTAVANVAGLGLYTVRGEMQKSVDATLARVAKIGYREVEFAGYFGKTPKEIAAILKANGLTSPSVHVPLNDIRTKFSEVLDTASAIGHQYIVCPYIDEIDRGSADSWRKIAADLNVAAAAAKKRGFGFAYHNHDFEFKPVGGTTGMSILLTELDAKLVNFEVDLFWITKAQQDPLTFFKDHPGRVPLVHVKDMGKDGKFADVGTGTIDFAKIFAKAKQAGIKHYYVERDDATDAFGSITTSYASLTKLLPR